MFKFLKIDIRCIHRYVYNKSKERAFETQVLDKNVHNYLIFLSSLQYQGWLPWGVSPPALREGQKENNLEQLED